MAWFALGASVVALIAFLVAFVDRNKQREYRIHAEEQRDAERRRTTQLERENRALREPRPSLDELSRVSAREANRQN